MSTKNRLSHNPFALLAPLQKTPDEATPAPQAPTSATPEGAQNKKIVARAVVRLERTGRGGKEVTVIDQLKLGSSERECWLKAFKSALGCGGVVEEDRLVLQGDQRERVRRLLSERGVKKITG